MKTSIPIVLLLCAATTLSSAIPKPEDGHKSSHDRVHEKPLSDAEHLVDDEHNPEYDHEAFLGEEEARTFDQLTPEESQARLGNIYDKIDSDKDSLVTEEELVAWIKHVQNKYIVTDTERQWKDHEPDTDDKLTWEAYIKRTYGLDAESEDRVNDDDGYNLADMLKRDRRRWEKADTDGDQKLTKAEFTNFLHPEEVDSMRDIVIEETLEDIDRNGDGFIDLEEYIADMWPSAKDEEEPDWVKTEREQFGNFRDKNKDGRMDREEVRDWIIPPDYDHSEAEAKHLIFESDANRDGKLSKEEVLNKHDLFVGSQATDFGDALVNHEEL